MAAKSKDKKDGKKNGKTHDSDSFGCLPTDVRNQQANKPTAKELTDGELDKVQGGLIRFPIKN